MEREQYIIVIDPAKSRICAYIQYQRNSQRCMYVWLGTYQAIKSPIHATSQRRQYWDAVQSAVYYGGYRKIRGVNATAVSFPNGIFALSISLHWPRRHWCLLNAGRHSIELLYGKFFMKFKLLPVPHQIRLLKEG